MWGSVVDGIGYLRSLWRGQKLHLLCRSHASCIFALSKQVRAVPKTAALVSSEDGNQHCSGAVSFLAMRFLSALLPGLPREEKRLYRGNKLLQKYELLETLSGQIQSRSCPSSLTSIWCQPVLALPRHEPVGFYSRLQISLMMFAIEEFWTRDPSECSA